jgi:hypothetical protein
VQERDHVSDAIAVDELARVLAAEQELVAALLGTADDDELLFGQVAEASRSSVTERR